MDKLSVLQHQNQKLAVQLEEKRRENRALETRLGACEARDKQRAQTLLCVRRLWDQLNSDLQHLCSSALQQYSQCAQYPAAQHEEHEALQAKDPFLAALLVGADEEVLSKIASEVEDLSSDCSTVEQALVSQSTSSKRVLSQLLDAIRTLHGRPSQPADTSAAGGDQERSSPTPQQLQSALDAAVAQQRLLSEQHSLARDRLKEAQLRIKQLEEEAEDHQQALRSAQRKLSTLQQAGSQPQQPSQQPHTADAVPAPAPGHSLTNGDASDPSLAAQHEETHALLVKRTAELDNEREAHEQTRRELSDARGRLSVESTWVEQTARYQALRAELTAAQEALAAKQHELEALLHEKEQADQRISNHALLLQSERDTRQRLAEANARVQSLLAAKTEADTARAEAESTLAQERQRLEGSKTADELKVMVEVLQKQLHVKSQQLEQAKVPASRIAAFTEEAMASKAAVAAAQAERDQAQRAVSDLSERLHEAKKREDGLQERVADMQAFVDVLTAYAPSDRTATELATAQGQVAALQSRCDSLQSQLQSTHQHNTATMPAAPQQALTKQLSHAEAQWRSLSSQLAATKTQVEELTSQLASARADCQLFTQEVESTSTAYEEMQSQNQRLLGLLATKEEDANALVQAKRKLQQSEARLQESLEHAQADLTRLRQELADANLLREASEREMGRLAAELAQVKEQVRGTTWRLSAVEVELRRRDESIATLNSQLDSAQKATASARQDLTEEQERSAREKHKRQRLEEENKSLSTRVSKLRKTASGSVGSSRDELNEELEAMRKLLNCSVCHDRQKNVVIVKCGHVFCDECVNRNLASRNRKCPGCGLLFSASDVKQIFY